MLLPDGPARDHAAVVRDGVFADIGPREAVTGRHPAPHPGCALDETLLMPGLVDTHHHLTQSFGKALVFGEPSEIFRRVWVPLEGSLDEESAYLAAKLAALESLRGGFTTVCDAGTRMEPDVGVVAEATGDAGIRCVLGMICNDLRPDGSAEPHDAVIARAQAHLDRCAAARPDPPVAGGVDPGGRDAPHPGAPSRELCRSRGAVFQTHVNEHLAAVERSLERHGRRPWNGLFDDGVARPAVPAGPRHAPHADRDLHAARLRRRGELQPGGQRLEGQRRRRRADLRRARHPLRHRHRRHPRRRVPPDGRRRDGPAVGVRRPDRDSSAGGGWTWLDHATAAGADAAGLRGVTGAIAPGLAADYLLVDLDVPEVAPSWDLEWELVRLTGRDQILAVVVAGQAAALARMAGRLGRPTADRRRPAPGPEGRRGRAGADRAPHLDRAPHSLPHNGHRGMTAYAIMALTVLVGAFVQGSTGLGFALISGPVIGMIEPRLLPVFLLIQMIPLNGYVTWRERHALDIPGTTWISLGRFAGTFGGLAVLFLVTDQQLSLLIGASTVLAVLMTLLAPSFEPGKGAFLTAGLVTGVTETSTGVGGPPLALVYQHRPAPVLRSTVAACFLVGEIISLAILAVSGKIAPDQVSSAVLLLPAVIVGALLSRLVHHRLNGKVMRYFVLGFALVSGIAITAQAV